jgi:predicted DNA-binding transcriptional regulator AlpA
METASSPRKIINKAQLKALLGKSDMWVDREERAGRLPARIRLSANSVGWFSDEIDAYLDALPRGPLAPRSGPKSRHDRNRPPSSDTQADAA